jgi:hypothetical protein
MMSSTSKTDHSILEWSEDTKGVNRRWTDNINRRWTNNDRSTKHYIGQSQSQEVLFNPLTALGTYVSLGK